MRGKFITIEGSEGAGKSTNIEFICASLSRAGIDFAATREPGGTPMAEQIRELMLAPRQEAVQPLTELLLAFAARSQHVAEIVEPTLAAGQWVVCDRFTDASYAYQGAGRGIDNEIISRLEQWVQGDLRPDLTLYLDLPPRVGAARIADREKDRVEQEAEHFFTRVRQGYLQRAAERTDMRVIDASQALADVQSQIEAVLAEFLQTAAAGHDD